MILHASFEDATSTRAYAENATYVMIGIDLPAYGFPESASSCRDETLSSLLEVYRTEPYRLNKISR